MSRARILLNGIASPVYFAYVPTWGRLNPKQIEACKALIAAIDICLLNEGDKGKISNLNWLKANYEFTLLLNDVSNRIEPAWKIRENVLSGMSDKSKTDDIKKALESLQKAPIEKMFRTYASRVRSRGELGTLSSINQRVWGEFLLLKDFLEKLL